MENALNSPDYTDYTHKDHFRSFQGLRVYIAYTYICFNVIGFIVNIYVLYVIAPLLLASHVKVPKSILFYIFVLCTSDILTLTGMVLLIIELYYGTWTFSIMSCISYMFVDSMQKFVAPIIVVLISRTCYLTVCLEKKKADRASTVRYAVPQIIVAFTIITILLWPVFVYTEVSYFPIDVNHTHREIYIVKKCGFVPPTVVQIGFNITACILSYAIPLFGFIYWYLSVPFFLRKRAGTTLIRGSTSSNGSMTSIAIKKVTITVLVLLIVYVVCWTPYWLLLFLNQTIAQFFINRTFITIMYVVHLLPYVSCCAYPLIFTIMNRAIQREHNRMLEHQRKRLKDLTIGFTRYVRGAFSSFSFRRLANRNNALFLRSSSSFPAADQGVALRTSSRLLRPNGVAVSQSHTSFTNVSNVSNVSNALLESTSSISETLIEHHRRYSFDEIEETV